MPEFDVIGVEYKAVNITAYQKELQTAVQANKDLERSVDSSNDSLSSQGNIIEEVADDFTEGMRSIKKSSEDAHKEIKKGESIVNSLKSRYRELIKELGGLDQGSKAFNEVAKEAAKVKDRIDDINVAVSQLSKDTKSIDALIQGAQGILASFSIAKGAVGAFGDESEDLQKSLLKAQSAMLLLSGVQQVYNAIQKENILVQYISNAQKKAEIINTQLLAAAESKNIIVRNAATIAQKALNVAMAANPGTVLLTIFAAIAGALYFFTSSTKEAASFTDILNKRLAEQAELLRTNQENINRQTEINSAILKRDGATEFQINEEKIKGLKGLQTEQEKYIKSTEDRLALVKGLPLDDQKEQEEALAQAIKDNNSAKEKLLQLQHQEKVAVIEGDIIKNKAAEDEKKRLEDEQKKRAELIKKEGDLRFEARQREIQLAKEGQEEEQALLTLSRERDRKELQERLAETRIGAEETKNMLISFDAETVAKREAINEKYRLQDIEKERQYQEALTELRNKEFEDQTKNTDEFYARRDIARKEDLMAGRIDQKEFDQKQLSDQLALLENQLLNARDYGQSTIDIEQKIADKKFEIYKEEKDKEAEEDKKKAEERKEREEAIAQSVADISSATFDIVEQRRDKKFSNELDQIEERKEAELKNEFLTQRQKAEIQKKYEEEAREIKTQQFQRDRAAALTKGAIDGALAVLRALATGGPTAAIVAGVAAAAQIAVIAAQPIPQFKEGEIDIQGPGTGTSDSILARISRGESVMTAAETKKYKEHLLAMRKGDDAYEDMIMQRYTLPILERYQAARSNSLAEQMAASMMLQNSFDDTRIVDGLRDIKPATSKDIRRLEQTIVRSQRDQSFSNRKKWRG